MKKRRKPLYLLAWELKQYGLSYGQIAEALYGVRNKRTVWRANFLVRYARDRVARAEILDKEETSIAIDYGGGERDPLLNRSPTSVADAVRKKHLMSAEEASCLDLEELIYNIFLLARVPRPAWGEYVAAKALNRKICRIYGARVGSKPYPRALAYVYTVVFLSVRNRGVFRAVTNVVLRSVRKRSLRKFWGYVREFMCAAAEALFTQ